MKKIFVFLTVIMLAYNATSQAPQKMSYQCVVRNAGGVLITNQSVGIRISILQGSPSGTLIYQETYSPNPQTNANGLLSVEIGGGVPVTGTFTSINWGSGLYFLKTETDPAGGTNYTISGANQILSVPYAFFAKTASTAADAVTITGNQTITGIKTFSNDLLVTGLTVGTGKGSNIYNTAFGQGALSSNTSGYNNSANGTNALTSNTNGFNNTASGFSSLKLNTTGNFNTANGSLALSSNTTGGDNTAIGYYALTNNSTGYSNTSSGSGTLSFNATGYRNTANGRDALYSNTTGYSNTATGTYALTTSTTGYNNSAYGNQSLYSNTTGYLNTAIGDNALSSNTEGNWNTASGSRALNNNLTGHSNTAFGAYAGYSTNGIYNVFLGSSAGYYETGSNKLFIDNSPRANEADARIKSLIYGVFNADPANQVLTINGNVGIGTTSPNATLDVEGTVVIGSGGKIFSEIREVTGTTPASGYSIGISYPSGYTMENTRVLSVEINQNGSSWSTLGMYYINENSIGCTLGPYIELWYPNINGYHNKAFRLLLMKVQ